MTLFTNPHRWASSMVSSWLRFWIFAIFLTVTLALAVHTASSGAANAAWGMVVFLSVYQLGMLYALRRILFPR